MFHASWLLFWLPSYCHVKISRTARLELKVMLTFPVKWEHLEFVSYQLGTERFLILVGMERSLGAGVMVLMCIGIPAGLGNTCWAAPPELSWFRRSGVGP